MKTRDTFIICPKTGLPTLQKNLDEEAESETPSNSTDSVSENLLAGYPGAALLVGDDGSVVCSNAKGAGLEALIQHEAAPEIKK